MIKLTRLAAAAAATALLTLGSAPIANADAAPADEPCAKEAAQVSKAEAALARVTAVFERQKDKVKDARADVAAASKGSEKKQAKQRLADAKQMKVKAKKAKKAQLQRLAHADERLAECEAEQST